MPRRIVFCLAAGIAIGSIIGDSQAFFAWPLITSASLVFWIWRRQAGFVVVGCAAVLLGVWRTSTVLVRYDHTAEALAQTVEPVHGVVVKTWLDRGQRILEAQNLHDQVRQWSGTGRVEVSGDTDIVAGVTVELRCRWRSVSANRRLRSVAQGLVAECRFPDTVVVGSQSAHWRARLARVRGKLLERIQHSYHAPQSDLLAGILLGVQETMTTDLRAGFRATGTSHIVALSGFNVTIIITVLATALTTVIGRRLAFWPMVGLVIAFVIMTGASASVTRAGVMALLVLCSGQLGRPVAISRILAYTFIGMILANPFILLYDLGFQLSFLATLGLVYLSGSLEQRWHSIPEFFSLRSNLSSTTAAMMVTEPLLLWTFGRLSLIAPFVNLVVLPIIPVIMATGAVGLLLPIAVPITDALLRLVLAIIGTAAGWPIAQTAMPWWAAGLLAALCGYFVLRSVYETIVQAAPHR